MNSIGIFFVCDSGEDSNNSTHGDTTYSFPKPRYTYHPPLILKYDTGSLGTIKPFARWGENKTRGYRISLWQSREHGILRT